jgi:small subunit ribosomal protein S16
MLRIRLRRVGKKGKPSYRIVVAQATAPRDGRYLEWIGNYDPMADPPAISLKEDRAVKWLQEGAQPSDAVKRILDKNGILVRTPLHRTTAPSSPIDASEAVAPSVSVVAVAPANDAAPAAESEDPVAEDPGETSVGESSDEAPAE